jgi:WD40 repeat protein
VAFAPDGQHVFSGGEDTTVRMWDVKTGKEQKQFTAHKFGVSALVVSPDGKELLSTDNETVCLWKIASGELLIPIRMLQEAVTGVAFGPDGPRAVSVSNKEHRLHLWAVAKTKLLTPLCEIVLEDELIDSVALSADTRLAITAGKKSVCIWDLKTKKLHHSLKGHTGPVIRAIFSPDGKLAASGGMDATIRIWDVETGKELRVLRGATSVIVALAFDWDGGRLLSGASARRDLAFDRHSPVVERRPLRLWDPKTGQELSFAAGPAGAVWAVAFSSDGDFALSGGEQQIVQMWALPR